MSSPTPEPPEENPPKRPRKPPVPAKKDSGELDLWDFEQTLGPPKVASVRGPETLPPPKNRSKAMEPVSRGIPKGDTPPAAKADKPPADIPATPRPAALKPPAQAFDPRKKVAADDLGDLDDTWSAPEAGEKKKRASMPAPAQTPASSPAPPIEPADVPPATPSISPAAVEEPPYYGEAVVLPEESDDEEIDDEIAEDGTPSATATKAVPLELAEIRKRLGFSKLEKIGMIALAALLVIAGITLTMLASGKLGGTARELRPPSYPVKGSLITVKKLSTYWRAPVVGKDSARRGTKLIPVAMLELEGGPCALRAFFRDEKGDYVGDTVNRTMGTGTLEISATAGLEDPGMHAAFRTGATKLWKLEVFEAPSADSPGQDFKKILETPVSADFQH